MALYKRRGKAGDGRKQDSNVINLRINGEIRVPEVRLISSEGEMVGVVSIAEALKEAENKELDLVEISPNASPPVCKVLDYGKYRYQEQKKSQDAKKIRKPVVTKEVVFSHNIEKADYETKLKHVKDFLDEGHRVKVSCKLKARDFPVYQERVNQMLLNILTACEEVANVHEPIARMNTGFYMTLASKK